MGQKVHTRRECSILHRTHDHEELSSRVMRSKSMQRKWWQCFVMKKTLNVVWSTFCTICFLPIYNKFRDTERDFFFPLWMQHIALFPQWQHPQEEVLLQMPNRGEPLPLVPEYLEGPSNCVWGPQLTCHQVYNEGQSCTLEVTPLGQLNHAWAMPNYVVTLLPRITLLASPSFLGSFIVRITHVFFCRCYWQRQSRSVEWMYQPTQGIREQP